MLCNIRRPDKKHGCRLVEFLSCIVDLFVDGSVRTVVKLVIEISSAIYGIGFVTAVRIICIRRLCDIWRK